MNIEDIRNFCLSKKAVTECFPFDKETLVFKVMDKIFALVSLESNLSINLKCEPEKALFLREHYPAIVPGFHMNKTHWNTVRLDSTIEKSLIYQLIDDSYNLIIKNLTKKQKDFFSDS